MADIVEKEGEAELLDLLDSKSRSIYDSVIVSETPEEYSLSREVYKLSRKLEKLKNENLKLKEELKESSDKGFLDKMKLR